MLALGNQTLAVGNQTFVAFGKATLDLGKQTVALDNKMLALSSTGRDIPGTIHRWRKLTFCLVEVHDKYYCTW